MTATAFRTADITLADFFCGAGDSSTGAVQVPGVTLRVAANHWHWDETATLIRIEVL